MLPGLAALFDRELARTISIDWVPDGPAVMVAAFGGWLYSLLTLLAAVMARLLAARFAPKLISSNDS